MKLSSVFSAVVLVLCVCGVIGCNHASNRSALSVYTARPAPTYALAVNVRGGLQPTPGQWAALQAKFARNLADVGAVLVTDVALAEHIIRVEFVPNENDPENSGRAMVLSVRKNTLFRSASASTVALTGVRRYPTSFGFGSSFLDDYYGLHGNSFYGYGNAYYDGYSYASPTLNQGNPGQPPPVIPPVTPPHHGHRHPIDDPGKCPPLLAAVPTTPYPTYERVAYPRIEGPTATSSGGFTQFGGVRPYVHNDGSAPSDRTFARSETSTATSNQPAGWFSRLFSNNDSGTSNSRYQRHTGESYSSNNDRSYSRSETYSSRSDSTYSNNDSRSSSSSYHRPSDNSRANADSTYNRSEHTYSRGDSDHSRSDSSRSSSSSSYSPPSSSSAPAPSPPPEPSTTENKSSDAAR